MQNNKRIKIGLEIHAQLTSLKSKLFCSCSADYRRMEVNSSICPICVGHPGTLPVLNSNAVSGALKIAIALRSKPSTNIIFYRKNYFYPDLPKNFQISQYDKAGGIPLSTGGFLDVKDGVIVRIRRIQLEEDPGRLAYEGNITNSPHILVDYNRSGIPLVEIVTEPDLDNPKQARIFLQKLKSILEHLGVCDGGLDGALRCDANISVSNGGRVEIKNINSLKGVERALSFEIARQTFPTSRSPTSMETRHWDNDRRVTVSLRVKEKDEDYRYFPEPDLVPIEVTKELVAEVKSVMPELPEQRRKRFIDQFEISTEVADVLTAEKAMADFFEKCCKIHSSPLRFGGWVAGVIQGYLNKIKKEFLELDLDAKDLSSLSAMVDAGDLTEMKAKEILLEALQKSTSPLANISTQKMISVAKENEVEDAIEEVFKKNPEAARDALNNGKAVNFLMGLLMKQTNGRADPATAREAIKNKLSKMAESAN